MSQSRIKELHDIIIKARNNYYNDQPTLSDKAFDAYVDELRVLDPTNPAVTNIGSTVAPSVWKKARHIIPMGSLDKVNTPDEFKKWYNDTCDGEVLFVSEKLDGISIELVYEDSKFVQAITRGDGTIGEDISINVIKMAGVPRVLSGVDFTGSFRGEIILTKTNHKKYFADKANPRNAASGVAKRLDSVGAEYLTVLLYQVIGDIDFKTEKEQFDFLISMGCKTPNHRVLNLGDVINATIDQSAVIYWTGYQHGIRDNLDYDIDGLVFRINDLDKQLSLGDKDLRPKGAKAFKFENEARESIIRDIIWQVGNSGRLTPVAVVDPVVLVGATVTRASVYNMAYIEELGIGIGAKVLVVRANDVIPRIEEVIVAPPGVETAPVFCPSCSGGVLMDGENLICTNPDQCTPQISGRIKNWVSELNILELGDTLIEKLVASGLVKTPADLYKLTEKQLANLDRMGEKSAKNVYDSLWKMNPVPLDIFIGGLSIQMIGSSTIRLLMDEGYDKLSLILALTADQIESVKGIGPIKAEFLASGLKKSRKIIDELLENGVEIKAKVIGSFTGKTFAFTGSMKNKRAVLENMVVNGGGAVKSSVGKGLSYLVIDDINSTSSKAVAARKFGTTLISEDDFLGMV